MAEICYKEEYSGLQDREKTSPLKKYIWKKFRTPAETESKFQNTESNIATL